jgi:hypothetical protein
MPEARRLEEQRRGRWIMRLLRRARLLLALPLLTSGATASAEGAWVLWERWFIEETGDSWTALGSEVSQWACNRASEREYAQAVRKGVERNGRALKVNDQTFIFYTCLPDTVDPRGPKWK